jgi:hypothetical protein
MALVEPVVQQEITTMVHPVHRVEPVQRAQLVQLVGPVELEVTELPVELEVRRLQFQQILALLLSSITYQL